MAYRGRGRGGRDGDRDPHQPYGGSGAGRGREGASTPTGFVWQPPGPSTPQPPVPYQHAKVVYTTPAAPQGCAYQHGVDCRAPSPAPAPYQPAHVSPKAPATSTAALAKEVEQKLFTSETTLARPAAAAGKKVMIRANHFPVNFADKNLFHYDVAINPESKSRATNREVLNEHSKGKISLGGKLPAYDGRKSLHTEGSLPFESEEFVVKLVDQEKKDKERAEREYKITIRIAGRTDLYHLQQFLRGRQRDMPQETIQVLDVVLRESSSWKFPVDDRGTRMTVQYFVDRYNYRSQYTSWPCLQSGNDSSPVYLPMESCTIVEGQRYSKKLNDKLVSNILRATCQRPQQWEQSIREMVLQNKYGDDRFAQEFGIKVCSDLVSVLSRVLPPPMKIINGGTVDNWACLSFSRMRAEVVQRFCSDLIQMCNATGMTFYPRSIVDNWSATPNNIETALEDVHRRTTEMLAKQGKGNHLQLLILILPEVSGSYGKIKKVWEAYLGIVSQCSLPRHACRPNKQYLENVALKINVKAGGRNTVLEQAFVRNGIPFVSDVPTIIFGAVAPPPPGEDSASSITAVVASMEWPEITKYRGLVSAQSHRKEIIDLFNVSKDPQRGSNVNGGMIRELLIAFRRKTGRRHERIIFYRDRVSEGQFSHVLLHEMDAIRKACASLEEGHLPPVTFVVVQKSPHTRLFPEVHGRRDMTDKSGNILPGTVVDLMICHPTEFDFYLCSHAGIQGTSSPTHYHVLYDENHFTADALQSLTNNLCYTYARCTRAVSVGESSYCGSNPSSSRQPAREDKCSTITENVDSNVQVFVKILDLKSIPMTYRSSCTIEEAVSLAFMKAGIHFSDFKVQYNNRKAHLKDTISFLNVVKDTTLYIQPRLTGGTGVGSSSHKVISLHDQTCTQGDELFDIVTFPPDLHGNMVDGFFVSLALEGRKICKLMFELLEESYVTSRCPSRFRLEDIFYDQAKNKLSFKTNIIHGPFSSDRYFANMEDAGSIFDIIFRFDESKVIAGHAGFHGGNQLPTGQLPKFVQLLIHDLKVLVRSFQGIENDVEKWKYFLLHLALMSPKERFYLEFDLHLDYLGGLKAFQKYLGSSGTNKLGNCWKSDTNLSTVMRERIMYRYYVDSCAFSRWSLSRNYITHAWEGRLGQFSEKQAEAAMYTVPQFIWQIYYIRRQLRFPSLTFIWETDPTSLDASGNCVFQTVSKKKRANRFHLQLQTIGSASSSGRWSYASVSGNLPVSSHVALVASNQVRIEDMLG